MTHTAHTTGIIDVGGGFRAIFGAGVEDRCLEEDVGFDHCYGISAGSANLASYLARQQGRAHTFYTQYAFRKEYASMENYITKRNFCDLDYVYGTLSNSDGENPLDYAAFSDNPATFTVVAANGEDGSSRYFDKSDMRQDDYTILKASSAVPVACQPVVIDDVPYFDGGIAGRFRCSGPLTTVATASSSCSHARWTWPANSRGTSRRHAFSNGIIPPQPNVCSTATARTTTRSRSPGGTSRRARCSSSPRKASTGSRPCRRPSKALSACTAQATPRQRGFASFSTPDIVRIHMRKCRGRGSFHGPGICAYEISSVDWIPAW